MLEVKNLTKVYKTKEGADVRALDGVSIRFDECGMVFLLGKSGSGKSTLLNMCGGLDTPDSGEIIIKGRSSKDFAPSDFDSYRNTYVGFVFQEYNILNEFTVEDNIALALELQNRSKERGEVENILKEVELENFAKRKPNTLSGGQKQRVAIARALVKKPKIIMADEPTGALDSNTGKQVFDTLKKLSETKLVIVVSHDREFAEIYGDRIIELKDGKIVSDVKKTRTQNEAVSENLHFIGTDTVTIKSGAKLSNTELNKVREFISSCENEIILTSGKEQNEAFKKIARIDETGAKSSFRATKPEDIRVADEQQPCEFIRSKLPVRHAFRIGASSLRIKPFRLAFTILLSVVAFTMFGLFSTINFYDKKSVLLESYLGADYEYMTLLNRYEYTNNYYREGVLQSSEKSYDQTNFSEKDLKNFRNEYGNRAFGAFDFGGNRFTVRNVSQNNSYQYYLSPYFQDFSVAAQSDFLKDRLVTKETDLASLKSNEVIVSTYFYDCLRQHQVFDPDTNANLLKKPNGYDEYANLEISIAFGDLDTTLRVAGVFRKDPPSVFDRLKEGKDDIYIQNEIDRGAYFTGFVSDDFYQTYRPYLPPEHTNDYDEFRTTLTKYHFTNSAYIADNAPVIDFTVDYAQVLNESTKPITDRIFYFNEGQKYPNPKELVVSSQFLDDYYFSNLLNMYLSDATKDECNAFLEKYPEKQIKSCESIVLRGYYGLRDELNPNDFYKVYANERDYENAAAFLHAFLAEEEIRPFVALRLDTIGDAFYLDGYKIAGFFTDEQNKQGVYVNAADKNAFSIGTPTSFWETVTDYRRPSDAIYSKIYVQYEGRTTLKSLIDSADTVTDNYTFYSFDDPIASVISVFDQGIYITRQIFLWVGVATAAFAMLLLFNFISVSITYKKKEIGILRAVGARSADVFRIFYSESAVITAICYALAMIASFVFCGVINDTISGYLGIRVLVFGPLSWLVMLGIALLSSFLATFLPVYNFSKRKPVDSIRAL